MGLSLKKKINLNFLFLFYLRGDAIKTIKSNHFAEAAAHFQKSNQINLIYKEACLSVCLFVSLFGLEPKLGMDLTLWLTLKYFFGLTPPGRRYNFEKNLKILTSHMAYLKKFDILFNGPSTSGARQVHGLAFNGCRARHTELINK